MKLRSDNVLAGPCRRVFFGALIQRQNPLRAQDEDAGPQGPGRLTILERAIAAAHLPFSVGCLIIALVGGAPGSFLVFYLGTHSVSEAWSKMASTSFSTTLSSAPLVSTPVAVVTSALFTFSIFFVLYFVRYLRKGSNQRNPDCRRLQQMEGPAVQGPSE